MCKGYARINISQKVYGKGVLLRCLSEFMNYFQLNFLKRKLLNAVDAFISLKTTRNLTKHILENPETKRL